MIIKKPNISVPRFIQGKDWRHMLINLNPISFQPPCTGGQICKLLNTTCTGTNCLAQAPECVNPTCDVRYHLCYKFRQGNQLIYIYIWSNIKYQLCLSLPESVSGKLKQVTRSLEFLCMLWNSECSLWVQIIFLVVM